MGSKVIEFCGALRVSEVAANAIFDAVAIGCTSTDTGGSKKHFALGLLLQDDRRVVMKQDEV